MRSMGTSDVTMIWWPADRVDYNRSYGNAVYMTPEHKHGNQTVGRPLKGSPELNKPHALGPRLAILANFASCFFT